MKRTDQMSGFTSESKRSRKYGDQESLALLSSTSPCITHDNLDKNQFFKPITNINIELDELSKQLSAWSTSSQSRIVRPTPIHTSTPQ